MKQEGTTFNPLSPVLLESQATIRSEPSIINNAVPTSSLPIRSQSRSWTTGVCDCQRDEETCWWGCWCNTLLQARTTQQFETGFSSRYQMVIYGLWLAMYSLLIVYSPGLAFVVLIGGAVYITWKRVYIRSMIRQKLGIRGTCFEDCCVQSCCCCCGSCQEAREAKVYLAPSPKHIDFCSGEDLSSAEEMHDRAVGCNNNETSTHSPLSPLSSDPLVTSDEVSNRFDPVIPEGGTCFTHIKLISATSKLILIGWIILALLSFYYAYVKQRADNIAILLLVFVQPFLILYFVYWRARRQHVSIDYVIKCFAVGFWMTPFQAIILESILQTIIGLAFLPILGTIGGLDTILALGGSDDTQLPDDAFPEQSYHPHLYYNGFDRSGNMNAMNNSLNDPVEMLRILFTGGTAKNGLTGLLQRGISGVARRVSLLILGQMYSNTQDRGSINSYMSSSYPSAYSSTSLSFPNSIFGSSYYNINTTTTSYIPKNNNYNVQQNYTVYSNMVQNNVNVNTTVYGAGAGDDGMPKRIETLGRKAIFILLLQKNIFWVLLLLFLNAYVVAAGVEETMKHFVVRCCPFPTPLKDPQSVLIYLVVGALGFATAENIEYVFGSTDGVSIIPGTSLFVGELLVLLMRVCMPVHVICSVMHATNLSKVLMGQSQMSLFRIMLPALVLHGTFDFFLFVGGALGVIYAELDSLALEVSGLVVTACMALAAACWAYCTYKKVEKDYNQGWQAFANESDEADIEADIELVVL